MSTPDVILLPLPSVLIQRRRGGRLAFTFDTPPLGGVQGETTLYVEPDHDIPGDFNCGVVRDAVLGLLLPDFTPLFVLTQARLFCVSSLFEKHLKDSDDPEDPLLMAVAVAMIKHAVASSASSSTVCRSTMKDGDDSTDYDTTYIPWPGLAKELYVRVTCAVNTKGDVTSVYAVLCFDGGIDVFMNENATGAVLAAALGVGAIDRLIAETRE